MEQLTRILSWTFVFGAIAALLYTNFKPTWHALLDSDVPVERVQGSATGPAAAAETTGTPASPRAGCAGSGASERPADCAQPSS